MANSDGPHDRKPEAWAVGITNDPTERKKQRMDDGELMVNWRECKAYSKAGFSDKSGRYALTSPFSPSTRREPPSCMTLT